MFINLVTQALPMNFISKLTIWMVVLMPLFSDAQEAAAIDSIKQSLAKAKTPDEKFFWLENLSRTMMNVNLEEADAYGKQLILFAEESRDRSLMTKAYMSNGLRYSYMMGQKTFLVKSIENYNKALEIARQNKLEE